MSVCFFVLMAFAMLGEYSQVAMPPVTQTKVEQLEILKMMKSPKPESPFPAADFRVNPAKALKREKRRQKTDKKNHKATPSHRYNV